MLTFVVLELPGCWVEEVGENPGVLTVVFYPVVEDCVGRGNEAANDVGDRKYRSIEFFGLPILVHSAQDIRHNVRLPRDMVNGKIEFLESVQPSDLAGGRFCHCLEVLECRAVGVDDELESEQVVSPLGGRFHES